MIDLTPVQREQFRLAQALFGTDFLQRVVDEALDTILVRAHSELPYGHWQQLATLVDKNMPAAIAFARVIVPPP